MTERTVTEQQVIDAMDKFASQNILGHYGIIYDELFPELPKFNELIFVWDGNSKEGNTLRPFHHFNNEGRAVVSFLDGSLCEWDNYRRQTPAERGEG
jgi:hypothetical protein